MIQYNDNIKTITDEPQTIDEQLAELNELCKKGIKDQALYKKIRKFVMRDIKIDELAVTRVLQDLLELKVKRKHTFDRIAYFVCNSDKSYQKLGRQLGCSGQTIFNMIKYHSKKLKWLDNLRMIKRKEDGRRFH